MSAADSSARTLSRFAYHKRLPDRLTRWNFNAGWRQSTVAALSEGHFHAARVHLRQLAEGPARPRADRYRRLDRAVREHADETRSLFFALLVIPMLHQTEEHLWPGGFRQFANARVFKSGNDDWPVDIGGVALVNIGWVWLPVGAAALMPSTLYWVGLGWIGLTLVNAITHIVSSIRFRIIQPRPRHLDLLFVPFTVRFLAIERCARRALRRGHRRDVVARQCVAHPGRGAVHLRLPFVRNKHHPLAN